MMELSSLALCITIIIVMNHIIITIRTVHDISRPPQQVKVFTALALQHRGLPWRYLTTPSPFLTQHEYHAFERRGYSKSFWQAGKSMILLLLLLLKGLSI